MWKCPKCGRVFERINQGHYCGKAPENVNEYIELQIPESKTHISELRNIILECIPGVTERIAWSMPRYEKDVFSVCFAACKNHISFYTDADILELFGPLPAGFIIKKNALYLPYNKPLPKKLIEDILKQSFGINGK